MYMASMSGSDAIASTSVNVLGILCLAAKSAALSSLLEHIAAASKRGSRTAPFNTQSVILPVPTSPNLTFPILMNILTALS